jgi:quinol monooxygenase YgiN
MIVLIAMYHGQTGTGDEVEAQLKRMAPLVKQHEPGCTLYHACRSTVNADLFLLYEHYVDETALQTHRETAHFKEIIEGAIIPLLEKRERFFYDLVID